MRSRLRQIKANVYAFDTAVKVVSNELIEELQALALKSDTGAARICLHERPDEIVQRMIISLAPGAGFAPHRQNKSSSVTYLVTRGHLSVFLHEEDGRVLHTYELSPTNGNSVHGAILEVPANIYRSSRGEGNTIFFEVTDGPFDDNSTEWLLPRSD